ncbi:MAG: anhydro-N-acetylmuramic acid kinase [Terriglobia bacterium]
MGQQTSRGSRLVVGLISGTSMDGIDAALVRISGPEAKPRVRLMAFETLAYSAAVRQTILRIATGEAVTAGEISQLNFLLGELFAEAALRVCQKARVPPSRLAVIGSHGQTIYHQGVPTSVDGRSITSTLQFAEPSIIAERTGAPVVADFRTADMAAGGQGAPLVPMVDYLLLRAARRGTVALNIGGIANLTVIPAGAAPEEVFGFDTGPGNMIIDGLVRYFTSGQEAYDAGGRWAARGRVIEPLLAEILRHPFFAQPPPKSAGREQFGQHFLKEYFLPGKSPINADRSSTGQIDNRPSAIDNQRGARPEDLLRTATELTVRTIADALERFVLSKVAIHRLIISGGGAHNRLLEARLTELLPKLRVNRSDEFGLDVDAKEAIAFALLADRTLHGLPGNLPSVTGARRPVVLGKIMRL